jgi:hypothetical protein
MPKDNQTTSELPSCGAACSPVDVPFEDLPRRDITIHSGLGCACPNGSVIEVWRIKEDDGFHIKLRRKLDDGKMSILKFGMSFEAAVAFVGVLQMQIYPEENADVLAPAGEKTPTTKTDV